MPVPMKSSGDVFILQPNEIPKDFNGSDGAVLLPPKDATNKEKLHQAEDPPEISASTENSLVSGSIGSFSDFVVDTESLGVEDLGADDENEPNCVCFQKLVRNYVLPGVFGVYRYRYVERLSPNHAVSKQLLSNLAYYSSKIRCFFGGDILPDLKELAVQLYFPTGQVEADGLSAISGEIWMATYLLLGIHKVIREADFYSIRSAYSSIAWDSAQTYRHAVRCFKTLQEFKLKVFPLWKEVEAVVGVTLLSDCYPNEESSSYKSSSCGKRKKAKEPKAEPSLCHVKLSDDVCLQNKLNLTVVPEKHVEGCPSEIRNFHEMDYGGQVDIIKNILKKPMSPVQTGAAVLARIDPKLKTEQIPLNPSLEEEDSRESDLAQIGLTCTKAIKILHATLKMLFEEVRLSITTRFDTAQLIEAISRDIYETFEYAEWVCNKFAEFHSMLRLCYNFALLCFDLDLPSFESVVNKEEKSGSRTSGINVNLASSANFNLNNNSAQSVTELDEQLEIKVVSLTGLMMDASGTFASPGRQPILDEDFDWQDFYRTDYHAMLQKLPIRIGNDLMQFSIDPEMPVQIRKRGTTLVHQFDEPSGLNKIQQL